ncbi:hypothetical protein QUA70_19840 [Microcoleus sp. LAD1_D5]|uniref:hypothetical protein n=1 Tax=Microcoleus sp. LAD1_D5 TaxID=2818813 RepID=UPI002FD4E876
MRKLIASLFALGLVVVPQVASASFGQVHRSTGGARDRIVVPNQTPGSSVPLMVEVTRNRNLTLNACGWGRFQHKTGGNIGGITDIKVGGVSIASNMVVGAVPTCASGVSNVNHPVGSVFRDGNIGVGEAIWYIRGGTGAGSIVAAVSSLNIVRVKANNCGFASFRITASRPFTEFETELPLVQYILSSLPTTNSVGLVCRKTGNTYTTYAPASGF